MDSGGFYRWWLTVLVFVVSFAWIAIGVAGPGLTWDEPAYRNSQVRLAEWWSELSEAESIEKLSQSFAPNAIDFYWEFNRHGPNFHPPMGSYFNLLAHGLFGFWIDDLSSRRLASSLELAAIAALFYHFLGLRFGALTGLLAACSVVTMPRLLGDAHLVGTDIPMTLLWTASALAFWNSLRSRAWQWALATFLGGLFLCKFSGLAIALPLGAAFAVYGASVSTWSHGRRWLGWSLLMCAPILPVALVIFLGGRSDAQDSSIVSLLSSQSHWLNFVLVWPLAVLMVHTRSRKPARWPVGLEAPWVVLAVAPFMAIACNPTWWHNPVARLANYFELSFGRQEHLPDIGIFYLGRQYVYSLPWHNGWVLMAVTIPLGVLGLGLVGSVFAIKRWRVDPLGVYFLAHVVALPIVRMFGTPAHDGVRLFLPTFVFWAGLAGLGGFWLTRHWSKPSIFVGAFLLGPVWAGIEAVRFHPHELSYYNIGLCAAQRLGFEVSYWYDAVTPGVLRDLNRSLPKDAVLAFPSPSINPEVFVENQSKNRLRGDLQLDVSRSQGFPFMLLLTHSSKSTVFSRLLYGMEPWYRSDLHGARLFSVVDPDRVALAWALTAMISRSDGVDAKDIECPRSASIIDLDPAVILSAGELLAKHGTRAEDHLADNRPEVASLVRDWVRNPNLRRVIGYNPDAMKQAAAILARRMPDVMKLRDAQGYPPETRLHGFLNAVSNDAGGQNGAGPR